MPLPLLSHSTLSRTLPSNQKAHVPFFWEDLTVFHRSIAWVTFPYIWNAFLNASKILIFYLHPSIRLNTFSFILNRQNFLLEPTNFLVCFIYVSDHILPCWFLHLWFLLLNYKVLRQGTLSYSYMNSPIT